jgi:SAM-dependent methyltransferase
MDRDAWNERYTESDDLIWAESPNRFVEFECAGLSPGRALDLACGEGRNAVWLAERGWQVTAVDFSERALAKGRGLARARQVEIDWFEADLLDYRPPGAYDLVIVFYLQLSAPERSTVLARAATAVAPRGTLLVVGHDLANLTDGYGGPQDPSVLFTTADIVRESPGLVVERAERVRRPVATDTGEAIALDALVRLRAP